MSGATQAPPRLNGYTFVRQLGSGGFADVYLYEQHLPKRNVAVKVMHPDGLTDDNRDAFVTEANIMAQLAHPYIVKIYQADVADDGRPYIVMEYCSGPNLGDRYRARPFSVVEALRTGIRLSGAIATAHAAGVLHRDIKPQNVLTNDYGWPALTDFGISSVLEEGRAGVAVSGGGGGVDTQSTGTSQSVGMSIPWSPPEMFEDDPRPDVRSDVFALAATVWTLLAGRTPFEVAHGANSALELMGRIERGIITPMGRPEVPPTLVAVLRKGMAVDPAQRYQSAVEFARALQSIELQLSYTPTPLDVPNLNVAEPSGPVVDSAADATRIRSVTSIEAQPAAAPPPISAPPAAEAAPTQLRRPPMPVVGQPLERTVLRGGPAVTPSSGTPEAGSAAPETTGGGRRSVGVIVGVVIGVLVLAGVGLGIFLGMQHGGTASAGDPPAATQPGDDGGDPIVGLDTPSTPVLDGEPTRDGGTVTFAFGNADPQEGDWFRWARCDASGANCDTAPTTVDDPAHGSATVTDVAAGERVCIEVYAVSSTNKSSLDPLDICDPR